MLKWLAQFSVLRAARRMNERISAMNGDTCDRNEIGDNQDETLVCDLSDEAVEAAAGVPGYPNVTEKFTAFGVTNCLLC
jgi:hypothetical protein